MGKVSQQESIPVVYSAGILFLSPMKDQLGLQE
jgi:hypothetical protein